MDLHSALVEFFKVNTETDGGGCGTVDSTPGAEFPGGGEAGPADVEACGVDTALGVELEGACCVDCY